MSHSKTLAVLGAFMALPSSGAELKQETLDAWDLYIHVANVRMQNRAKGHFLWIDESPHRASRVHSGEIVVSPMDGHSPQAVPSGLIHHWIGGAFIRSARLTDVIGVVRSYDRYKDFYKPTVVDARTLSQDAAEDRFSMMIADKTLFAKRAVESDCRSRFVEIDSHKWYSVTETTRLQEFVGDRPIRDGEASGYLWRMFTLSRYEERDGGVYVETEAIALSRPIPSMLKMLVEPIVNRVSKAALTATLEQTRDATGSVIKSGSASAARRQAAKREAANE